MSNRGSLFLRIIPFFARPYGRIRQWFLINALLEVHRKSRNMGAISKLLAEASFSETCLILTAMGARLGARSYIENHLFIHNARNDYSNLTIGQNAYVGKDCFLDLSDKITIGDNAVVAMRATILTHFDGGNSTISQRKSPFTKPVHVQSGAYVGAGAILMPGVTICEGTVVAPGAVVEEDSIVQGMYGGIPAKPIRVFRN